MNKEKVITLKQQAKENEYIPHGDVSKADCVIGFSFGYRQEKERIIPGKTNEQLARFIENNFSSLPLILQFEINDALQERVTDLIIKESRQKGEYLNSREIALQALEFMEVKRWKSAVIVTHPAMEARNDAICRKLGMMTILPSGLEAIEYDMESAQPWTRNRISWWEREESVIDTCIKYDWI